MTFNRSSYVLLWSLELPHILNQIDYGQFIKIKHL
jgi:hypothetical protein